MKERVLGAYFWQPEKLHNSKLRPEHFTGFNNQVFQAMQTLDAIGGDISEETIAKEIGCNVSDLFKYKKTDRVAANVEYLENQIIEQDRQMQIKLAAEKVIQSKYNSAELIDLFNDLAKSKHEDNISTPSLLKDCVMESINQLEKRCNGEVKRGITTGLSKLDEYMGGFQDRRLYYIGGRPSEGKSALLLNFMLNAGVKSLLFSAESGRQEFSDRAIIRNGRINSKNFMNGIISDKGFSRIHKSCESIYDKPIIIDDTPNISITQLCMRAYEYKKKEGIEAIFIDYIQILDYAKTNDPHHLQVAAISKQLKRLARELNIPVICAAQLRRDADGKKPMLSDFSDSTQIERDADVAIFIYNLVKDGGEIDTYLCIEKNRDGMTGDIRVDYEPQYFLFKDLP